METEKTQMKSSIKGKIFSIILISEVLLTVIFVGVVLYSFQKNLRISSQQTVSNIHGIYDSIMKNDTKMLSAALDVFSRDETFARIYERKDRVKLYEAGKDLFANNRNGYGMTHFYYINNDGTCFLRMHQPELADDVINRATFKAAKATGKTASGIELGQTAFALRVVRPYYLQGTQIGFVEFGEEIDHFDQIVKTETGADIIVLVNKNMMNEQQYRLTSRNAGRADNWDELRNYTIVSETFGDRKFFSNEVFDENDARAVSDATYLGTVKHAGRILMKGAFPITDAAERQVGVVMVLSDVTAQVVNARNSLLYLIATALALLGVTTWITFHYLKSEVINPMVDLSQQVVDVSMGNVERKLESDRTDEIGMLVRSFDRMRISLKMALSMASKH